MKHPLLQAKLDKFEFEGMLNHHIARYMGYSFSVLILIGAFAYFFLVPIWGFVPLFTIWCAGVTACCLFSWKKGHRRALQDMRAENKAGPEYQAPPYFS